MQKVEESLYIWSLVLIWTDEYCKKSLILQIFFFSFQFWIRIERTKTGSTTLVKSVRRLNICSISYTGKEEQSDPNANVTDRVFVKRKKVQNFYIMK